MWLKIQGGQTAGFGPFHSPIGPPISLEVGIQAGGRRREAPQGLVHLQFFGPAPQNGLSLFIFMGLLELKIWGGGALGGIRPPATGCTGPPGVPGGSGPRRGDPGPRLRGEANRSDGFGSFFFVVVV